MLYFLKETVKIHEWHILSFHIQFTFICLNAVYSSSILTALVTVLIPYPSYVDVVLNKRRNNEISTVLESRHFVFGSGKDMLHRIEV